MTEPEELLKLIDAHIEVIKYGLSDNDYREMLFCQGMNDIRWLVYNFFNAPKKEETPNDQQDFEL